MTRHLPGLAELEASVARVIPCLSLWEPWASLIVCGAKWHETRHWPTKVRGLVAIHAAKKCDRPGAPDEVCEVFLGPGWARTRPAGCVVAVAQLTGCYHAAHLVEGRPPLLAATDNLDQRCGNFDPGRYGFRLDHVRPLREPLPLIGRQGWFDWRPPADLAERLLPEVDRVQALGGWEARHA
ncbi:ASCH domain-containing protein [Phenylobacterium sp.]|uniref:ASCH domain-containing protein n=1 Tax=Phenylobacterium sp. TaxID=1871053 RepID=UPI0025DE1A13|nr:ASCH domain-containing protein [Phenylobacterium sp.]MBX3482522.1 ASCH domain-containing protein [Phenylobacterium sp.]